MAKHSVKAIRELTAAITELAEVVRGLDDVEFIDPAKWKRIAGRLEKARGHTIQAAAFES